MGSRLVKNMNSEQNNLSKNFSFYVDNLFSCAHLETCDKFPFLSGLLPPVFFYSASVLGKNCNIFCFFKAEMSRVGWQYSREIADLCLYFNISGFYLI